MVQRNGIREAAGTSLMIRWARTCSSSRPASSPRPGCRSAPAEQLGTAAVVVRQAPAQLLAPPVGAARAMASS